MASTFTLTLDTTVPQDATLTINSGAAIATARRVDISFATSDADTTGYQTKLWGDLDGAAASEAAASWLSGFDAQYDLTFGDGMKFVYGKIRDDVGNETVAMQAVIELNITAPVVTISIDFAPTKISKVPSFDLSTGSFYVDQDASWWQVMVVPDVDSPQSAGTQFPTAAPAVTEGGPLLADTYQAVTISGLVLESADPGDGPKILKIFAQNSEGVWSV